MARSTDEILTQLLKLLPGQYAAAEPLLAGQAAALALAEAAIEELQPLATIEGGEGIWLTLHAHGLGVHRAPNESDETLRLRLRTVQDQVTKPAIEAAVNRIIAPDVCRVVEWFEGPYLDWEGDGGAWLDNGDCLLSGGPRSFLVVIPKQSTDFEWGQHLDVNLWLDNEDAWLGEGPEDPVYAAICNEVERIRAAGTFWRLVLEEEG